MGNVVDGVGIKSGVQDGIEWKVALAPMGNSANGYVKVAEGHPWFGKSYDDIEVDVHGGLTYGCSDGWVGFDTAHCFDEWSDEALAEIGGDNRYRYSYDDGHTIHWTLDKIVTETRLLATQAAGAAA